MTMINQLLKVKGRVYFSVRPDETVYAAIEKMAEKNVGSVLVMDRATLVGIFTERDYARNVVLKGRSSPQTLVRDIMSTQVAFVEPDDTVEDCMALMTEKRVRHLPVVEDEAVVGIISIGDLVKSIIDDQMGQMAASIAHELNQPLAAIVTNGNAGLRWLAKTTPDFDEVRAALQRIVSDGHRASQLIGTIRSMFKKDGQKKAPVDVNQLIQKVLGLMQGELQNQQVSLQTELEAQPIQVSGDRVQLQQVILNLITNAIDAMGSVTEHPRVLRVKSETDESDAVVITVEDSGAGIDPKGTDRIFDMFYTTKSHGMGIGLAICRSIIEAHGGRISASSGNPHGSVFRVVLPTCELRAA
jgi:signal transduction histidine kinase